MSDLIMIEHEAKTRGHSVRIVLGNNRWMRKLLATLGSHQLPIFDSIDDALDH
jgi:hypothetical protein